MRGLSVAKNWERHLLRIEGERFEVREVFQPFEYVTDAVFITKQGQLACFLRIDPVPFECLDDDTVEHKTAMLVSALRNLDVSMALHQYVAKHGNPPLAGRMESARTAFLEERLPNLYSLDVFWAVVYDAEPAQSKKQTEIDAHIQIEARYLETVVSGLIESLSSTVVAKLLNSTDSFSTLTWLANYEPRLRGISARVPHDLDAQMTHSGVDCVGPLKVGNYYVRVLTIKNLPHGSTAFCLRDLYKIPCGMLLASEWKPLQMSAIHKGLKSQRRHYGHTKASITSRGVAVDGGVEERDLSLKDIQAKIERDGLYLGEFSLTVILYSEDPAMLRKAVADAHSVFQQLQGALVEQQGMAALVGWLGTIPGNGRYNIRRIQKIHNVNYGDLSFLFGAATGDVVNEHLGAESLVVLENFFGQPFHFNLHKGQVGHTVMLAKSGGGKTYFMNMLIDNAQKHGGKTFVLDILNGYRAITEALGGSYTQLGRGAGAVTINPFSLEPTKQNVSFLFSFVRLLVESDGGGLMTNYEILDMERNLWALYNSPRHLRRLGNLMVMPAVEERLARWITRQQLGEGEVEGQYAYLFDNVQDSLETSDFQTFNFPSMQKDHREALEALVFYIVHHVNRQVALEPERPKFVFMDEALEFLRHAETQRFICDGLMRYRHYNTSLILATQSLSHLEGTAAASIIEQCQTRVYGANPGIDVEEWARRLQLTATEARRITTLRPAKELLIQGQGVVTVNTDRERHLLYSGKGGAVLKKTQEEVREVA